MQLGVMFGSQLLGGGMFMRMAVMGASVAGSLLLKDKQKSNPNKLNDLKVSSATYGRSIPIVYGTMKVTGNCFWSTDFREDHYYMTNKGKRVEGSKGEKKAKKGKAQEVYDYYANYAMGLCAGPVDAILRIWADNNLIYTKLNANDDDEDVVGPGFSQQQSQGKNGAKSGAGKGKGREGESSRFSFRFYKGDEEQRADDFMRAKTGADKSPGYRGLAYLMFEDFPLKDFGNRIPTITAEVSVIEKRRPQVEVIENMEPKTGFSQKVGGKAHFCPVRNRIYHTAVRSGRTIIRAYDIEDKVEVSRVDIEDIGGTFIGLTHKGDFVFSMGSSNVRPLRFFTPDLTPISSWGRKSIGTPEEPYEGIFGPRFAVPLMGVDKMQEPVGITCVHGWDGIHTFDDTYSFLTFVTNAGHNLGIGRMMKNVVAGAPGSITASGHQSGAFAISKNNYTFTEEIFAFDPSQLRLFGAWPDMEKCFVWPRPDFASVPHAPAVDGTGQQLGGINWAGAILGSKNLGVICWWMNGPESENGLWAFKLDYETGEELWRKRISTTYSDGPSEGFQTPSVSTTFKTSWFSNRLVYTVDWQNEKASSIRVGANVGDGHRIWLPNENFGEYYLANMNAILYWSSDDRINDGEGNWIICYLDKKVQNKVLVSDIVRDVSKRCRIPDERIDTTGLTLDEEITGFMIENPTAGRAVLEELSDVFQFDAVESDHILKYKTRGKNSIATIKQEDLGVIDTDFGGENEYYVETRMMETELPERCVVEFIDPQQKYETGSQGYKRPIKPLSVMGSTERLDVTLNMAMKPSRAKTLAQRILYAAWGERTSHEYTLPRDYLAFDPSDVFTVQLDNGVTFLDRITDIEIGADWSMKTTTVSQFADVYSLIAVADGQGGNISLPYTPPPNGVAAIFDVPYLFDNDVDQRTGFYEFYWAALAHDPGFTGGTLSSRREDETTNESEGFTRTDALWGYVDTFPVPPPPHGLIEITDTETVLRLIPGFDWNAGETPRYSWETITDADWPSEENMIIIGDEVMLFKNAEEQEDGSVLISHLIRGYKGTGIAAFNHTTVDAVTSDGTPFNVREKFVLVHNMSVQDADHEIGDLNRSHRYMLATGTWLPSYYNGTPKVTTGATRKPWQVGGLKRSNASNGNITISFARATRYGGQMLEGTGSVPLNEAVEKYEMYWLNSPYDRDTWDPENPTLWWRKTELTDTSTVTVSAADLTTAGKNNKMDMHFVIYQLSDQIGRGFPRPVTIPYSMFGL